MVTAILRNALLFPDTEELLITPKGKFQKTLSLIMANEDNITRQDITYKSLEYGSQKIRALIKQGKLKIMEGLKYPDHSISEKEYLSLKRETLLYVRQFFDCLLPEKVKLITEFMDETEDQQLIQMSTLLIPNDRALIEQLNNVSIEEATSYYRVSDSVINFKIEEYNRQDTRVLFMEGKMPPVKVNRLWYKNSIDDDSLGMLWDQSFYGEIEENKPVQVNISLSQIFSTFEKKVTK